MCLKKQAWDPDGKSLKRLAAQRSCGIAETMKEEDVYSERDPNGTVVRIATTPTIVNA